MKKFKIFGVIALCLSALFTTVGCDKGKDDQTVETPIGNVDYAIAVKRVDGNRVAGVTLSIYDGEELVNTVTTDTLGNATFNLPGKKYKVVLSDYPKGIVPKASYTLPAKGGEVVIDVSTKVIEEENPKERLYKLGDVMYDFTLTDTNGNTINLVDSLKKYKAVVINFWFINCGFCRAEFPHLVRAYKDYKEDILLIGYNISYDTAEEINDFAIDYYLDFPLIAGLTNEEDLTDENNFAFLSLFGYNAAPKTVYIDRYGLFSYLTEGAYTSTKEITNLFSWFSNDNYNPAE